MYRSIRVENFRGIERLSVDNLGAVNLFVGSNSVGKTSLLEVLWLAQAPGNPLLTRNLTHFRGFQSEPITPELLWYGLFNRMAVSKHILVECIEASGMKHSLEISLSKDAASRIRAEQPTVSSTTSTGTGAGTKNRESLAEATDSTAAQLQTLNYRYSRTGVSTVSTHVSASQGMVQAELNQEVTRPMSVIMPTRKVTSSEELADRFTQVMDTGRLGALVDSLKVLEPALTTLSLGYAERQPMIRGHVSMDTPVPLPLLGGGAVRMVDILLAVLTSPRGLVLIDELENGFYYKNLVPTWKAIRNASISTGTQVFVTTHSFECDKAAIDVFSDSPKNDFHLHRLERDHGGRLRAVTYDLAEASTALEMNLEVR
jgi:predicted ATPase